MPDSLAPAGLSARLTGTQTIHYRALHPPHDRQPWHRGCTAVSCDHRRLHSAHQRQGTLTSPLFTSTSHRLKTLHAFCICILSVVSTPLLLHIPALTPLLRSWILFPRPFPLLFFPKSPAPTTTGTLAITVVLSYHWHCHCSGTSTDTGTHRPPPSHT